MQEIEKKYLADLQSGKGNFDAAPFALGPNEWINMENCRSRTTDNGFTKIIEAIGSTTLLSTIEPSVTFMYNGGAYDIPGNRFLYFQVNLTGPWHRIMCYSFTDNTTYIVLLSSQVTGGLNLSKDYFIHSAKVINGILYWTDYLNEQRKTKIDAGIKLNQPSFVTTIAPYSSPISQSVISLIRNPPVYPIVPQKQFNAGVTTNFTQNEAFIFSYFYIFRDFEESVGSDWSRLINYNSSGENWNNVGLTIPLNQFIEQDVLRINVVAFYLNGQVAFIIKTWDRNIATDAAAIAAHNAGTTALAYDFYNDRIGVSMGTVSGPFMTKFFDSVPIRSRALEIAKDRIHLGYNLKGYNTPVVSSLTTTVISSGTSGVTKVGYDTTLTYREITGGPPNFNDVRVWLVFMTELTPQGYYAVVSTEQIVVGGPPPSPIALPATRVVAQLSFRGADQTAVIAYYDGLFVNFAPVVPLTFDQPGSTTVITDISANDLIPFKTDSAYQAGIVFYDKSLRKCGLFTTDSLISRIPDRNYGLTSVASLITWTLSNASPVFEIPDWAYFYQIVITKNLSTRFFEQAVTDQILYARKNSDGTYDTNAAYNTLVAASVALAISLDFLVTYGFGYTFNENDLVKIYRATLAAVFTLRVLGTQGKYLIAQLTDIGSTAATSYLYEIRTPYQSIGNEPMYENGQLFAVTNPATALRQYGTLNGTINGDIYIKTRTHSAVDYFTEAMSPQDAQWQKWNTDASRANFVDKIGQRLLTQSDVWSNTIIEGTEQNGLSSFEALNQKLIPQENGPIQKLQLTSKVQDEPGIVMLAICEKETVSLYIGETQQYGSSSSTTLTLATDVIGSINVLKGSFGTRHPESVFEFRGNVFWWDDVNGKIIQYSTNGLFPVSNYDCTKYWKQFTDQFNSMTSAQIEALGNRPLVFMAVDPHHWELLVCVPKLLNTPPKGYLPDYPSTIYPFDMWDGQAKTIVFKLNAEPNYWQGAFNYSVEGFLTMNNKLFAFKYGQLYQCNSTNSFCNLFGVQYRPRIMPVFNQRPNLPKTPDWFKVESNLVPLKVYIYCDFPYQQSTDLVDLDFKNLEGELYSQWYRNKLVQTATGFTTNGLLTNQKVRSIYFYMLIEFTVTNVNLQLRYLTLGYQLSAGHKP